MYSSYRLYSKLKEIKNEENCNRIRFGLGRIRIQRR